MNHLEPPAEQVIPTERTKKNQIVCMIIMVARCEMVLVQSGPHEKRGLIKYSLRVELNMNHEEAPA